ncbi:GatB/YqeY domain-containing protein [Aerococcus christensenii]|uniref:GatB/YqeY domain-containing protein n=1 Tax=Aerococcus christensenii TaxID=87541 RepID=A0A0X8F9L6_9LACT|nr:GatB/YqeY domain-containing protein [Aerococcus christensenii]AMB93154.1 aspartyl-tRNA amidotransferase [Aerococcus christensenii]KXB33717.1 YqeY-like protein [Aerococcus christensenii]MDK8234143.1 GatB/YqeY domain-containing protein [Aerococcus christensenii]PKY91453.1 GatB/YqeY domain-containing protein [Aerococcus christensenii]WEB70315.1 GatB/YqeY domain-containing protein [Aerococcus christensenii]
MAAIDQINQEIKEAMKAKDKFRLSVIRMLKGALQKAEIDKGETLTEEEELTILSRELKQRKDSVAEFREAGRDDLADETAKEIAIVETYLPKQLSEEEITVALKEVIDQVGAQSMKDFGKVMGAAVKALKGKADGSTIQKIAKSLLS